MRALASWAVLQSEAKVKRQVRTPDGQCLLIERPLLNNGRHQQVRAFSRRNGRRCQPTASQPFTIGHQSVLHIYRPLQGNNGLITGDESELQQAQVSI